MGDLGTNVISVYKWYDFDLRGIKTTNISKIISGTSTATIHGNDQDNVIEIKSGFDTIHGEGGNDTFLFNGHDNEYNHMYGGEGYDTILGGDGDDTIGLLNLTGIEHIDGGLGTNIITVYKWYNLDLRGIELTNISRIIGGNYGKAIYGNYQDNVIDGKEGSDTLYGEGGNDHLMVQRHG